MWEDLVCIRRSFLEAGNGEGIQKSPYLGGTIEHSPKNKLFVLKGHGNEADFLGFLHKPVRHRSFTLRFERSDFGFEFADIVVIEKQDCL